MNHNILISDFVILLYTTSCNCLYVCQSLEQQAYMILTHHDYCFSRALKKVASGALSIKRLEQYPFKEESDDLIHYLYMTD